MLKLASKLKMNKKRLTYLTSTLIVIIVAFQFIDFTSWFVPKYQNSPFSVNGKNIAEALGYDKNAKLLVVNSDDSGAHPTFTEGVIDVMKFGLVKSTSIIVNDRNDEQIIAFANIAKQHPDWGIGIHLTLNNEYQERFPWAPVLPYDIVPSLYNADSLAWEKVSEVVKYANPKQVQLEFEAQIEKAIKLGINPTHIDSHMGTIYLDSEYSEASINGLRNAAIAAAKKFELPITVNPFDKNSHAAIKKLDSLQIIRPDVFFGFYELSGINEPLGYKGNAVKKFFTKMVIKLFMGFDLPYHDFDIVNEDVAVRMKIYKRSIKKLVKPGLNHFFMHAAHATSSDGQTIPDGKHHNAGVDDIVRQADLAIWSSEEMKQFLEKENIILINYSELKKLQEATTKN